MARTLINVDLSQAELRVMGILSGDEWMRKALQEDAGDFFDSHLMPVSFPETIKQYGSVDEYKEQNPVAHKEDRTKVKAVVYGLSFGRQAAAIGRALGISTWAAQDIMDNFLNAAPDLRLWREDVMQAAVFPARRDKLITVFGRKFQSEIITTANYRNVQREALSFLPQSTSSDIVLSTAIRIAPQLTEWGYPIINLVHDAIMMEGEEDNAEVVAKYVMRELRATGAAVLGDSIPFLSDWSMGKSWADLS